MSAPAPAPAKYCPGCEPERDPVAELLMPIPCWRHEGRRGLEDARASVSNLQPRSVSYDADDNRRWCALFHRKVRP